MSHTPATGEARAMVAPSDTVQRQKKGFMKRWQRPIMIIVAAIITVPLIACTVTGQLTHWMAFVLGRIYALGFWGVLLLVVMYAVSTVCMVPAAILNMGPGFLYGAFAGYLVTIVGAMIGAAGSYVLGQRWLKETMRKKIASKQGVVFDKVTRALGNGGVGPRHACPHRPGAVKRH